MKEKAKILILEDDETVRNSLSEILVRNGYSVLVAARPDEASNFLSENSDIDMLFCDCLLPQMTGVDFVKQARVNFPQSTFKVVLMSGIYTDKAFIQDAVKSTGSIEFIKKPFDVEQILKIIKKEGGETHREEISARKTLYQMFATPDLNNRQKRKVIESIEEVSGFDLPFLYSLLVETKSSGYLNIYHTDGAVSGISFCNGNIVGVDVDDRKTFLGEMLIQSGYANPDDVHTALRDKNNRKIGSFLIENNQLSPHAFDLILMEQMNVRLVRTIVDDKIKINFAPTDVEMTYPSIDAESLTNYLHDWIASKISLNWLSSLHLMWGGYVIAKSPNYNDSHPAMRMSLIKALPELSLKLAQEVTIQQLLDVKGYNEVAVYKAVHFLLTKGLVTFSKRSTTLSVEEQRKVLIKVLAEVRGKNSYEIVSYMQSVLGQITGNSLLREFQTLMGEEPSGSPEGSKLWYEVTKIVEDAIIASKDSAKSDRDREDSKKSEAVAKLKADKLMEEAKKLMQYTHYTKALGLLSEVSTLNPDMPQLHLYSSWAKMGNMDPTKKLMVIKDVELELMQVPADEKYDALFPFIVGLLARAKGDHSTAKKSFEKSVALNSSFIPARRELTQLSSDARKQDVFNMDLKQVVSGFFKKK